MIFSDYTIKELADRAKVSTATVSRILSGKGSHRPGTVERVRRIAEKMEAESRAREFGISECIGVLMLTYRDCLNSSYNSTLITSIVEGLAAENCTVQLMALPVKRMNLDHIRSLVIEHGIRALIVPEFNGPYSVSNELDRLGIPIVTIGNIELDGDKSEIVCTDNAHGRQRRGELPLELRPPPLRRHLHGPAQPLPPAARREFPPNRRAARRRPR